MRLHPIAIEGDGQMAPRVGKELRRPPSIDRVIEDVRGQGGENRVVTAAADSECRGHRVDLPGKIRLEMSQPVELPVQSRHFGSANVSGSTFASALNSIPSISMYRSLPRLIFERVATGSTTTFVVFKGRFVDVASPWPSVIKPFIVTGRPALFVEIERDLFALGTCDPTPMTASIANLFVAGRVELENVALNGHDQTWSTSR